MGPTHHLRSIMKMHQIVVMNSSLVLLVGDKLHTPTLDDLDDVTNLAQDFFHILQLASRVVELWIVPPVQDDELILLDGFGVPAEMTSRRGRSLRECFEQRENFLVRLPLVHFANMCVRHIGSVQRSAEVVVDIRLEHVGRAELCALVHKTVVLFERILDDEEHKRVWLLRCYTVVNPCGTLGRLQDFHHRIDGGRVLEVGLTGLDEYF